MSVHPIGKSIIHSRNGGLGGPPRIVLKEVPPCLNLPLRWPVSEASGVGNNPDAIPPVRRAKGVKRQTVPFRIIPERIKCPEHCFQSARAKDGGVFDDDKSGEAFSNEAGHLSPETTFCSVEAGHSPGEADVLTGEAANDNVGNNSI